jgi:hypothetical protein
MLPEKNSYLTQTNFEFGNCIFCDSTAAWIHTKSLDYGLLGLLVGFLINPQLRETIRKRECLYPFPQEINHYKNLLYSAD